MTAASVAVGLISKYPLQAARAKAYYHWLRWMGPWDEPRTMDVRRAKRLSFWTGVCCALDKQPEVC